MSSSRLVSIFAAPFAASFSDPAAPYDTPTGVKLFVIAAVISAIVSPTSQMFLVERSSVWKMLFAAWSATWFRLSWFPYPPFRVVWK